jgi:hypothetical protein
MLVAIADRISNGVKLTTMQKHRIRVAKGMEDYKPAPETDDMISGRVFEDEVAATLPKEWQREARLNLEAVESFSTFAHADFYDPIANSVKECKWSRVKNHEELREAYRWQLQWYYWLGAESVSLATRCVDGLEITDTVEDIARDEWAQTIIKKAVTIIDENWGDLDLTIDEWAADECPPVLSEAMSQLQTLTTQAAEIEERINDLRLTVKEIVEKNGINKAVTYFGTVTYTAPSVSKGFDSKKFAKDHADLYAAYLTKETKKAGYITVNYPKGGDK